MLSRFKETVDAYMRPVGLKLISIGIKPNHLTISGLIFGVLSGIMYATTNIWLALLNLLLAGLMDVLDGAVARAGQIVSEAGGFLDSVFDRYVEFFILIGIGIGNYANWILVIIALFTSLMVSYVRARAEALESIKKCDIGIFQRQERLFVLIITTALLQIWKRALEWGLLIIIIAGQLTIIQRIYYTIIKIKR